MFDSRLSLSIDWLDIEASAREQINEVLRNDFVERVAIMPDVHAGYGLPVGGVALLNGVISPNYVGPDIGCGMDCYDTGRVYDSSIVTHEVLQDIFDEIMARIPVGMARRPKEDYVHDSNGWYSEYISDMPNEIKDEVSVLGFSQMGTLGSGNHFIEIGVNGKNHICVTIHSGSRRIGDLIFRHFIGKYGNFMNDGTPEFSDYMKCYRAAARFALLNRMVMVRIVKDIIKEHTSGLEIENSEYFIEKLHNTVDVTSEGKYLHRKGAISASLDEYDIIPANQRDGVFVVRGLGNDKFLSSASHGCGRKMSRGEAKRTISLEAFKESMGNIVCRTDAGVLDESPDAYKDWEYVMSNLVDNEQIEIIDRIVPLVCVKG